MDIQNATTEQLKAAGFAVTLDVVDWATLVQRRADPADRRINRLHLLPASKDMLAKIEAYKADLDDLLLGGASPEDRQAMLNVLRHMKNKLTMETSGEELVVAGE